tara:strand:- start:154 stop:420 length:267 start_codon:yes stop_codon:yes gene_type:complete
MSSVSSTNVKLPQAKQVKKRCSFYRIVSSDTVLDKIAEFKIKPGFAYIGTHCLGELEASASTQAKCAPSENLVASSQFPTVNSQRKSY